MLLYIVGLLSGALLAVIWRSRRFSRPQRVLWLVVVLLGALLLQNYAGFGMEQEPVAQNFVLVALGVPIVLLLILAVAWPFSGKGGETCRSGEGRRRP